MPQFTNLYKDLDKKDLQLLIKSFTKNLSKQLTLESTKFIIKKNKKTINDLTKNELIELLTVFENIIYGSKGNYEQKFMHTEALLTFFNDFNKNKIKEVEENYRKKLQDVKSQKEQKDLQLLLEEKEKLLSNSQLEINTLKKSLEQIKGENNKKEKEILSLKERLSDIDREKSDGYKAKALPISSVYRSIAEEFSKYSQESKGQKYQLKNIKLELKGVFEHDEHGLRMKMLNKELLENYMAENISTLEVSLNDQEIIAKENMILVPDLRGFTEYAATSILKSLGLQMKKINQFEDNPKTTYSFGQCIKQSPIANTYVEQGDVITLIFIKKAYNE